MMIQNIRKRGRPAGSSKIKQALERLDILDSAKTLSSIKEKKKPGRPKGSKTKGLPFNPIDFHFNEVVSLNGKINSDLNVRIDELHANIANLNHQIIGYKAVISYLENQLGLKGSQ